MDLAGEGISAERFYGPKSGAQVRIEAILNKSREPSSNKCIPHFMKQLLGPSRTWKIFKKQQDAIEACLQRRNGLMCFAFEQKGGRRAFLVAHPKVFWAVNSHRFFRDCSTYEVIQEHAVCKLYFDVEFEYQFNPKNRDGDKMLQNFLSIVNYNLKDVYGVTCTMSNILDLDSSTNKKYSHHIVYQIPDVAFQDNYAIGNFVQKICRELKSAIEKNVYGCKDDIAQLAAKYGLTEESILEFFVCNSKDNLKFFIDEGVYTKNRHFRLLGSTKLDKNTPLVISKSNKYVPQLNDSSGCQLFLDSLITYFSSEVNQILECDGEEHIKPKRQKTVPQTDSDKEVQSVYPVIDKFILQLISPFGGIRRQSFFSSSSRLIYDIYGYRYCDNIKRHHKSNNIMFVIDLETLTFYQKCHDPDCSNFRSDVKQLPEEVRFHLEDDSEFLDVIDDGDALNSARHDETEDEAELCEIAGCIEDLIASGEIL